MKILKTLLGFEDSGNLFECDTIEHEGQFWLVPEWLEAPELGVKRPARMIPLARLRHQRMSAGWAQRFAVPDPVPRDVFEGHAPPEKAAQFGVIDQPDIEFQIPKGSAGLH